MSHFKIATLDQFPGRRFKVQQPQQIADGGAGTANRFRDPLMGHIELAHEPIQSSRLFDWVELLALNIFNQRDAHGLGARYPPHDGWDSIQPCYLRGPPPPFSGDQFVTPAIADRAD